MEKIQELVKEGKLSENLMSNKKFVAEAKEIFKSEKIEMDDTKLKQLMDQIEIGLKNSDILDDKALEQVSGGGVLSFIARNVIKTTTTVIGAVVVGVPAGMGGAAVGAAVGGTAGGIASRAGEQVGGVVAGGALGGVAGGFVGGGAGVVGGFVGYKIGKAICKAIDLE
jgi:hypothetical protein